MIKSHVHPDIDSAVRSQFSRERILWRGTQDPASARRSALPILFFAIPWSIFCLLWEGVAISDTLRLLARGRWAELSTWIMPLWGIPFVVIGLAMLSAPWYGAWRARNTLLLLTDERLATVRRSLRGTIVTSYTLFNAVTTVEVREARDGIGHIKLKRGTIRDSDGDTVDRSETYEHVRNVQRLHSLLLDAIRARQS